MIRCRACRQRLRLSKDVAYEKDWIYAGDNAVKLGGTAKLIVKCLFKGPMTKEKLLIAAYGERRHKMNLTFNAVLYRTNNTLAKIGLRIVKISAKPPVFMLISIPA